MVSYKFEFNEFPGIYPLARKLAQEVSVLLSSAIKKNGKASLIVSGGTTPVPFFEELSKKEIQWQKVRIGLADERWVSPKDPASNEALVKRHLLKNKAAIASFLGLYTGSPSPFGAEEECERRLLSVGLPFDVLVLGMGADGHTASLFPGSDNLEEATDLSLKRLCIAIRPNNANHERMSLTMCALLNSRHIFLHITGQQKRAVFEQVIKPGRPEEMPIRFILSHTKMPVRVYWAPQ